MEDFLSLNLPFDNIKDDKSKVLENLLFVLQDISFFCDYIREIKEKSKNIKIIGVDYGTSKIGLSISDSECKIAFPKDVLIGKWLDIKQVCKVLEENISKYQASAVVIGFPKTNSGELHKNCEIIFEIAKYFIFEKKIPTLLFDERFTTKYANRLGNNENKKINNTLDDAKSASVILQGVLDYLNKN